MAGRALAGPAAAFLALTLMLVRADAQSRHDPRDSASSSASPLADQRRSVRRAPSADIPSPPRAAEHKHQRSGRQADAYRTAYRLLQTGRYEDVLDRTADARQSAILIVRFRALRALGRYAQAIGEVSAVLSRSDAIGSHERAALLAERARLLMETGQLVPAMRDARAAVEHDPEQPLARFVRARVLAETGRIAEAAEAFRWFVRFYNRVQPTDAETLIWVARGAATYARWRHVSQIFHFCVNTLCSDILSADPLAWEAHWICGSLLLEKYNRAQAIPELQRALAVNPRAVEVFVALARDAFDRREFDRAARYARDALKIRSGNPAAWELIGDLALAAGDHAQARNAFCNALKTNPRSQSALAGWVAAELLRRGSTTGFRMPESLARWLETSRPEVDRERLPVSVEQLRAAFPVEHTVERPGDSFVPAAVVQSQLHRNPRSAVFLTRLGEHLEGHRRFAAAAACYREAILRMPEHAPPLVALGLLAMQVGRFDAARPILDAAFEADPFHVRVANIRKVLGRLESYRRHRTAHFVVYHAPRERLLAECAAEYLEAVYPELTGRFGFEPRTPTQIEIYADGQGQTAHEWFSARMVGLPWIQTIGASTGLVIAMASPQSGRGFNWGRVLRHEFVHVITLQQTDFRMPHWFTEALAVREEIHGGYAEPGEWMEILERRLRAGTLFPLRGLDRGFQRPRGPGDWTLAYCQSYLLARFLEQRHGPLLLSELIEASRKGFGVFDALERRTGGAPAELTRRYVGWIDRIVHRRPPSIVPRVNSGLDSDAALASDDPQQLSEAAYALLQRGEFARARSVATRATQSAGRRPWLASYVLARLESRAGDLDAAIGRLERMAVTDPVPPVIDLLAGLYRRRGDSDAALRWYRRGLERFPDMLSWHRALAALLIEQGRETDELYRSLQFIAGRQADSRSVPRKLLQMALQRNDDSNAVRFAWRSLFVDVKHAPAHRVLALDAARNDDVTKALRFWKRANAVGDPGDIDWQWTLAETLRERGHLAAARSIAAEILVHAPQHAPAAQLLRQTP
ncbi:MAG: tetratricopeptide repeat protein [Planctomycetota bacterium]|nr:MAG: tetratricopeptide repeat protein [Planctomycetota bacterium]